MIRRVAKGLLRSAAELRAAAGNAWFRRKASRMTVTRVNLCSGPGKQPGYLNIDVHPAADLQIDLSRYDLPLPPNSLDAVVCMSAINYFTHDRGQELISQVHATLKPGGIARFGVQDMRELARKYVAEDREFFFQLDAQGRERLEGGTIGDKFAAWFYGYTSGRTACRYFYDFESLAELFRVAGFQSVERKAYGDSLLPDLALLDNRPDQMFFLEAVK